MKDQAEHAPIVRSPTPLRAGEHGYDLVADYFEGQIDCRAFRARHPQYPVLSANPLVIEPEKGAYIYIAKFGAVVAWNCAEAILDSFFEDLTQLDSAGNRIPEVRDGLHVRLGEAEDRIDFAEVGLRELSLDKLKIISLALAQSVALDYFEREVRRAMARFSPVMGQLARKGKLAMPKKGILRNIGFAMEVRATVLENLTLFDPPPETWESESLAHLDSALFDQFDLEERHVAIEKKLDYLSDAGARVMDVLTTRESHLLEWIVIALISVEVVFFLWKELPQLLP